jgi:HEPN domain-containing protein
VLAEGDIADELIGFHAQQSVEKAIKAVLVLAWRAARAPSANQGLARAPR